MASVDTEDTVDGDYFAMCTDREVAVANMGSKGYPGSLDGPCRRKTPGAPYLRGQDVA